MAEYPGYQSITELVAHAARNAEPIAEVLNGTDYPGAEAIEAFIATSVPYTSNVVETAAHRKEVESWLAVPSAMPGSNALIDTTTVRTLTNLLAGEARLTPLTLWDLSRAVTALVCYDHLFHFAHPAVDDDFVNNALGERVLCSLPLPSKGPLWDPHGVRGLFNTAWLASDGLMNRLSKNIGQPTIEGKNMEELAWQWSMMLGLSLSAKDVIDCNGERSYAWASPGAPLLDQLWYELRTTPSGLDTLIKMEQLDLSLGIQSGRSIAGTIDECNCRSYVNERLAYHLQLPYFANTLRLPFRSLFYDFPRAVTAELPSVLAIDEAYVTRAAHADLIRGDPLVLPVFLALVLNDAQRPPDIWAAIAKLRAQAVRFRERRCELDRALVVGDQTRMRKLRKAIGTEAAALTERLADAAPAAGKAALTSVSAHPVAHISGHPLDWLTTGLSAAIAGARKLIPDEVGRRLIWRLCRPELRFFSDITMDSRAVIDSLPNVQRLWGLSDGGADEFAHRIDQFRTKTPPPKKAPSKKAQAKKPAKKAD